MFERFRNWPKTTEGKLARAGMLTGRETPAAKELLMQYVEVHDIPDRIIGFDGVVDVPLPDATQSEEGQALLLHLDQTVRDRVAYLDQQKRD
jgi:hypothetical protein